MSKDKKTTPPPPAREIGKRAAWGLHSENNGDKRTNSETVRWRAMDAKDGKRR